MTGDTHPHPLPRRADVYDFDECDEMTLCELATLGEVRELLIRAAGTTFLSAREISEVVDRHARRVVADARDAED